MKNALKLTATALALTLSLAARADLVSDGDFQQDTPSITDTGYPGQDGDAWTLSGNTSFNLSGYSYGGSMLANPSDPSDPLVNGENYWLNGAVGSFTGDGYTEDAFLSQTFATTAGEDYSISLWLDPAGGSVDDDTVLWDGVAVFEANDTNGVYTVTGANAYVNGVLDGAIDYNSWNYITIDPYASPTFDLGLDSTLSLGIRNDPSFDGLTGVDVEPSGGVAAPDAGPGFAMIVVTIFGLCAWSARKSRDRVVRLS